ncbi:hypothetical protein M407DRAFT_12282 [Tulasnella calospora MUT 4182]|uniref:Uncharacterized protein n=1 Tax=Tulasnella calospora MUT 4182 TaxID=1051891 RepID=A0A0C3Q3G6_9AGAM|nr:hypothetical protein M407DRAFT_12282 [Tulasnella calospora MUT 4182]
MKPAMHAGRSSSWMGNVRITISPRSRACFTRRRRQGDVMERRKIAATAGLAPQTTQGPTGPEFTLKTSIGTLAVLDGGSGRESTWSGLAVTVALVGVAEAFGARSVRIVTTSTRLLNVKPDVPLGKAAGGHPEFGNVDDRDFIHQAVPKLPHCDGSPVESAGHSSSNQPLLEPFPVDFPGADRSQLHKKSGAQKQRLSGGRGQPRGDIVDERGGESSSDWFSDPSSPISLTSSLRALSPLSSDLDPDSDHEQAQHQTKVFAPSPSLKRPSSIKVPQLLCCVQCGSSLVPLSPTTTTERYLFTVPMRKPTRSQTSQRAAATQPAPRRTSGRKRKANDPPTEDPPTTAPEVGMSSGTPAPAPKKKKRTAGPSAPSVGTVVSPDAAVPSQSQPLPPPTQPSETPTLPSQSQPLSALPTQPSATPTLPTIIDPTLLQLSATAQAASIENPSAGTPVPVEPNEETAVSAQPVDSTADAAPGDSTRNCNQRAPALREENAALLKANAELEGAAWVSYAFTRQVTHSYTPEKIKQLNTDLRTLKKYKVLWVKEYSKKAKVDSQFDTLIPRPPGEKGKNGWNLQDAMGLGEDDALYNEILVCVSRFA